MTTILEGVIAAGYDTRKSRWVFIEALLVSKINSIFSMIDTHLKWRAPWHSATFVLVIRCWVALWHPWSILIGLWMGKIGRDDNV